MANAFAESLPLIERMKKELVKLGKASQKIKEADAAAEQNGNAAIAAKEAATRAAAATRDVAAAQQQLIEQLSEQHQTGLEEQQALLRRQTDVLLAETKSAIAASLTTVTQAGEAAQAVIDELLTAQPPLLAKIEAQHQQGLVQQKQTLQTEAAAWARSLQAHMETELVRIREAVAVFQKNVVQQHDEFSAVASQLQVVSGRITAFAEVMNAAKFTTKLEAIDKKQDALGKQVTDAQQTTLKQLTELGAVADRHQVAQVANHQNAVREQSAVRQKLTLLATAEKLTNLTQLIKQNDITQTVTTEAAAEAQFLFQQEVTEGFTQQQSRQDVLHQEVQASIAELRQGLKQQLLLKVVVLVGVVATVIKLFIAL